MPGRANGRLPRRATDRIEDAAAWVLSAGLLLLAVAAVVIGLTVSDSVATRGRIESAERTQVTAVLTADAPVVTGATAANVRVQVPATWLDPSGIRHTGEVDAMEGSAAGTTVPVWLDGSGEAVSAPPSALSAVVAGMFSGFIVLVGGGIVLGSMWMGVRHVIGRANAAAWEREWARVGPAWGRGDAHPDTGPGPSRTG